MDWQDFKARLSFWYVKRCYKLDKQFTFMHDVSQPNAFAIRFLGKYDGVIVEYDNVRVSEEGQLSFDFSIIANPNLKKIETKSFERFTTNVMRSILISSIEMVENSQDENRKLDPVESVEERSIHEEGSAVSEERVPDRKPRKKSVRRSKKIRSDVQQSAADSSAGDQS